MNHLSESEIREHIRALARRFPIRHADALLVEEVAVDAGRNRIDMLYFGEVAVGIEIKSARDDLNRLPAQAASFSRYFEYMNLVADAKYVDHAINILPTWWGVFEISRGNCRTKLTKVRGSSRNPSVRNEHLLELLWKNELISLLGRVQHQEGGSSDRLAKREIRKALACNAEPDELRRWSLNAIIDRQQWRGIRIQQAG